MHAADRNIYIFTPDGWKHLGTNTVVQRRCIPIDTEDVAALRSLYVQAEDEEKESPC